MAFRMLFESVEKYRLRAGKRMLLYVTEIVEEYETLALGK